MIPRPATGGLGMPGEESVRPYIDEYQGVTDSSAPIAAHQVAAASFRAASVGHSTSNQNNRQRLPDALARKQPIAMAVLAAAFSCVVPIQGGSAPAEKPGTRRIGKSEINRDRSEDRLKIGTGELADLFLDTRQANRLDVIDHRLRGPLEAVFGSWSDRGP